jgi:hypothetical protein
MNHISIWMITRLIKKNIFSLQLYLMHYVSA